MMKRAEKQVDLRTVLDIVSSNIRIALDACHEHEAEYTASPMSRRAYHIASQRLDALVVLDHEIRGTFLNDEEY